MQRTITLKLSASDGDISLFRETLSVSAACFDSVSESGWLDRCRNGVELHRRTYHGLRLKHPEMPSQLVISARMKATEALKAAIALERKGKKVSQPQMTRPTVRYDARSMTIDLGAGSVSLATVGGRRRVPFQRHPQADRWLSRSTGINSADLVERSSGFWLKLVVTVSPAGTVGDGTLGADLGINRPVVTSDGFFLGKRRWKEIESRCFRLKRALQAKGTKSARRHLQKVRHRQQRFRLDCDRVLAKQLVTHAVEVGAGTVVLENLTGLRDRTKQRGSKQRRRHHGWSYNQLRICAEHKGEEFGVSVAVVDPRYTSQRCSRCGHVERGNRVSQARFVCRSCGFEIDADLNAARNIRWKHLHAQVAISDMGGPPKLSDLSLEDLLADEDSVNRPIVAPLNPAPLDSGVAASSVL